MAIILNMNEILFKNENIFFFIISNEQEINFYPIH